MRAGLAGLIGLGLAFGVGACASHSGPSPQPSTSLAVAQSNPAAVTTSAPASRKSAAPTATAANGSDLEAEALSSVGPYYAAQDAVSDSKTLSLNTLYDVAVPPAVLDLLATAQRDRTQGYLSTGSTRVVSAKATAVSTAFRPTTKLYPYVKADVCLDRSHVVTTRNGKPFSPAGSDHFTETLTFTNTTYPSPTGWRVSHFAGSEVTQC